MHIYTCTHTYIYLGGARGVMVIKDEIKFCKIPEKISERDKIKQNNEYAILV